MTLEQTISFQEKQLELLRRERAAAMEALDLAASLGNFAPALSQQSDSIPILSETCTRVRQMINMQTTAIYLAQEEPYDFILAFCDNPARSQYLDHEVALLINDNSFAYALQKQAPVFFLSSDKRHLLLHVIASSKRVLGMLVGELQGDEDGILDTTLKLFSVVMLSAAHALESFGVHQLFLENNKRLEAKVKERTHALQEANTQLSMILDSIQTGVLLINARNQLIEKANPAALAILRATPEDIIGKSCQGNVCLEPDENCPFHSSHAAKSNAERYIRTTDGQSIPIIENIKEIVLNEQHYFLKSFMDISEQKKLEQLKDDVERITRHDLKGPLNGIINLPDVIRDCGQTTRKQNEMLQHIKSAGYQMLKIINMSLDLYKMEVGTYIYRPTRTDILPIVQAALLDLAPLFRALSVSNSVTVDRAPVTPGMKVNLECDETLMYSLLCNLLTNAAEASQQGDHVAVHILRSPETTTIEIHNSGVIPEHIQKNFFGKYVTSGKKEGTGLGTYSAKLITDTMGGSISFTTSQEDGTSLLLVMKSSSA